MENYETTQEVAERLGKDVSWIKYLLKEGRFKDARKVGEGRRGIWLIPKGSQPVPPAGREKEEE